MKERDLGLKAVGSGQLTASLPPPRVVCDLSLVVLHVLLFFSCPQRSGYKSHFCVTKVQYSRTAF